MKYREDVVTCFSQDYGGSSTTTAADTFWKTASTPKINPAYTLFANFKQYKKVRVPVTDAERNRGYRQVPVIPNDECMLFKHKKEGPVMFTMQDCLAGLQIAFCDKKFVILQLTNAQPGQVNVPCLNKKCKNVVEFSLKDPPPHLKPGQQLIVVNI